MRRYEVTDFPENDKKSTNEFISRHLASNLRIGMSRNLTTGLILMRQDHEQEICL